MRCEIATTVTASLSSGLRCGSTCSTVSSGGSSSLEIIHLPQRLQLLARAINHSRTAFKFVSSFALMP